MESLAEKDRGGGKHAGVMVHGRALVAWQLARSSFRIGGISSHACHEASSRADERARRAKHRLLTSSSHHFVTEHASSSRSSSTPAERQCMFEKRLPLPRAGELCGNVPRPGNCRRGA